MSLTDKIVRVEGFAAVTGEVISTGKRRLLAPRVRAEANVSRDHLSFLSDFAFAPVEQAATNIHVEFFLATNTTDTRDIAVLINEPFCVPGDVITSFGNLRRRP